VVGVGALGAVLQEAAGGDMLITVEEELELIFRVLQKAGAPAHNAEVQAWWLVEADLTGRSSHGMRRLPLLVERIHRGLAVPWAEGELAWCRPTALMIDGQRGLGPVIGRRAISEGVEAARREGVVVVAVRNANHLGILSPYVEHIAEAGQIGLVLTTTEALVHPWGGRAAIVGTNPIAVGVPARPHPLVLDMATSAVSMGRILHHLEVGEPLGPGWAIDGDGKPTVEAGAAAGGALSPFGGAKGYALAIALEVLVGSVTGTSLGTALRGTLDSVEVCTKGDLFVCIEPTILHGREYSDEVSRYLDEVRHAPLAPGFDAISVPGDRMRQARENGRRRGIEVADVTWQAVCELA
jgi:LDH2 family malate/lactate/ureidoglycolate dehydrogenase